MCIIIKIIKKKTLLSILFGELATFEGVAIFGGSANSRDLLEVSISERYFRGVVTSGGSLLLEFYSI